MANILLNKKPIRVKKKKKKEKKEEEEQTNKHTPKKKKKKIKIKSTQNPKCPQLILNWGKLENF